MGTAGIFSPLTFCRSDIYIKTVPFRSLSKLHLKFQKAYPHLIWKSSTGPAVPWFSYATLFQSRASFSIRAADYQDVDDGSGSLGEYALALALGGMAIVWHDCASGQTARPYAAPGLRSATRRRRHRRHRAATLTTKPVDP